MIRSGSGLRVPRDAESAYGDFAKPRSAVARHVEWVPHPLRLSKGAVFDIGFSVLRFLEVFPAAEQKSQLTPTKHRHESFRTDAQRRVRNLLFISFWQFTSQTAQTGHSERNGAAFFLVRSCERAALMQSRNLSSIDRASLLVFVVFRCHKQTPTITRELPPTHGVQQSEARASLTSLRARRRPTEAPSQETGAANSTTSHFQRRPVVSSNPKPKEIPKQENDLGSLRSCLVEGDPAQITRNRRLRRRSLLLSVILQFAVLTALILVPLLSKTEPLPVGIIMPMPPYHRPANPARPTQPRTNPRQHADSVSASPVRRYSRPHHQHQLLTADHRRSRPHRRRI